MKYFLFILTAVGLVSCGETSSRATSENPPDSASEVVSQSASVENEESFDSFYVRFHDDTVFQKERIKFPLEGEKVRNFETESWSEAHWEFFRVRADQVDTSEYKVEMKRDVDTVTTKVYIENSDVQIRSVFARVEGKWYLVRHDDWF